MKNDVELYLNGNLIYFDDEANLAFNYTKTDLENPTVQKNSYSKTLTIAGTKENNQVFNDIWLNERTQGAESFNPSKRTPFSLFINGDIVESGYAKLDKIEREGNNVKYEITLYGGVGDFLYSLAYNENGDERKLSDLDYTSTGGTDELNFFITKDTISDAWNNLETNNEKWQTINFMPAYNGLPDNISTDTVLINTNGYNSPMVYQREDNVEYKSGIFNSTKTSAGTVTTVSSGFPMEQMSKYTPKNGYALGKMLGDYDEFEIRDLRSYNQRPCFRMKKFIQAISNRLQNGGYEVVLDDTFFNANNPYYEDAWVSLPQLSNLGLSQTTVNWNISVGVVTTYNGWYDTTYELRGDTTHSTSKTYQLDFDFRLSAKTSTSASRLYSSAYINGEENFGGVALQLLGYDRDDVCVAGSNIVYLTSEVGDRYLDLSNASFATPFGGSFDTQLGYYDKVSGNIFEWNQPISLKMDATTVNVKNVFLRMVSVANLTPGTKQGEITYGFRRGKYYSSTSLTESTSANTVTCQYERNTTISDPVGSILTSLEDGVYSNTLIQKKNLLQMDGTPADWLLSYCKLFNLIIEKDKWDKKVYIKTQSTFYTGEAEDINDSIDRDASMSINPIAFDTKWYDFTYKVGERSQMEQAYYDEYGVDYGKARVDTGYNFDADPKELLNNTVFNNAVDGLQKDELYKVLTDSNGNVVSPILYSPLTYTLWDTDGNAKESKLSLNAMSTQGYNELGRGYDFFNKVQFQTADRTPIDGSGVLVFYNGSKSLTTPSGVTVPYWLTDDLEMMYDINSDHPCWLYTNSEYDANGNRIAKQVNSLPQFSRYKIDGGQILYAWDIGKARTLYLQKDTLYDGKADIYSRFWKNYISDMYDIDTRVVECNVHFKHPLNYDALKKFYWFDGGYYALIEIQDYNPAVWDTVRCKFIKIQDLTDYSGNVNPSLPTGGAISISLDNYGFEWSGGTTTAHIKCKGNWTISTTLTASSYSGSGNGSFTLTVPENILGANYVITATTTNASATAVITQKLLEVNDFGIDPENVIVPASGGTYGTICFNRTIGTDPEDITATPSESWITATYYSDMQFLIIEVDAQEDEPDEQIVRSGYVTITDGVSTVIFGIDQLPEQVTFDTTGDTVYLDLMFNEDITIKKPDWVDQSYDTTAQTYQFTTDPNYWSYTRSGDINVSNGNGYNANITINQGSSDAGYLSEYFFLTGTTEEPVLCCKLHLASVGEIEAWYDSLHTAGTISVINNLTSTATTDALSAAMGKELNDTKQDNLVSGTNIKTINGQSLLGSGNIVISGGTGGTSYTAGANIDINAQNVISVTGITSYTGITSGDVTTALGYTPYNSSNPAGYVTSDTRYTAGSGISITGANNVISVTASSLSYWEKDGNTIRTPYNTIASGDVCAYNAAPSALTLNVIDNLTSTATTDALSANQGKVLKEMIENHSGTTYTAGSHIAISPQNVISGVADYPYLPLSGGTETGFVWFNEGLHSRKDISFDKNYKIKAMSGSAEINVIAFDGDFIYGSLDEDMDVTAKTTDFKTGSKHPVFIDGNHFFIRTCWVWDDNLNKYQKVISLDINQYGDATVHRNVVAGGEVSCFGGSQGTDIIADLQAEINALKQRVSDLEEEVANMGQ